MSVVRFGIIGCGSIAQRAFAPALAASESAELVAAASRSMDTASAFTAACGGKPVEGYAALLELEDVDAVYIALPIGLHAEWSIAAAESGKHVLCEKTLAMDLAQTDAILKAAEAAGTALLEGFMYQFHTQHRAVRELIESGAIGEPRVFHSWFGIPPLRSERPYSRELGGGVLLETGTYPVHAARSFHGGMPRTVSAILNDAGREVEIHGNVLLDFGHGRTASLAFGFDNFYRNTYSIWGSEGLVTLTRAYSPPATFQPSLVLEKQDLVESRVLPACDHFRAEIDAFCAGLDDARTKRRWAEDAREHARLLAEIRAAAGR